MNSSANLSRSVCIVYLRNVLRTSGNTLCNGNLRYIVPLLHIHNHITIAYSLKQCWSTYERENNYHYELTNSHTVLLSFLKKKKSISCKLFVCFYI